MNVDTAEQLFTLSEIAERRNVPLYRVHYVTQTRRIAPARRVGIVRLFDDAAVQAIGAALDQIGKRRGVVC